MSAAILIKGNGRRRLRSRLTEITEMAWPKWRSDAANADTQSRKADQSQNSRHGISNDFFRPTSGIMFLFWNDCEEIACEGACQR